MAKATDTPLTVGMSNMAQSARGSQAVARHYATSNTNLLPASNHHTRRHWNGKGNSWSACAAASSPERMSLKTRRDNGTRPAHLPERDRKTVADMGTSLVWGIERCKQKKAEQRSPVQWDRRGLTDTRTLFRQYVTAHLGSLLGCNGGRNKENRHFRQLGTGEGSGKPHWVRECQSRRRGPSLSSGGKIANNEISLYLKQ